MSSGVEIETSIPVRRGMDYIQFVPWLVSMQSAKNYLEIGVNMGLLLSSISVDTAIGIDPNFVINKNVAAGKRRVILEQTSSDDFFRGANKILQQYPPDFVFLDGMHLFEYLLRDFYNAERHCSRNALIVMHDCLPLSAEMCDRNLPRASTRTVGSPYHGMWTGDVWKIVPILKKFRSDLKVVCVDANPTGLVCVTNLDPNSTVLADNYTMIVDEYKKIEDTTESIVNHLYTKIDLLSADEIVSEMSHGCLFRV